MSKNTKTHTTFLDTKIIAEIVLFLEKNSHVKSYTAGIIIPKRPPSRSEGLTKITLAGNSLKVNTSSKRYKQEFFVYGQNLDKTAIGLQKHLEGLGIKNKLVSVLK